MHLVHGSRGSLKHVADVLLRGCWLHYKMTEKGKRDKPYAAEAKFMVGPGLIVNLSQEQSHSKRAALGFPGRAPGSESPSTVLYFLKGSMTLSIPALPSFQHMSLQGIHSDRSHISQAKTHLVSAGCVLGVCRARGW